MVLVGYWPLDEESGTTAKDYSRFNNDGDIVNSPTLGENGPIGEKSYFFNGTDNRISGIGDIIDNHSNFSIAVWIKSYNASDSAAIFDNYDGGVRQTSLRIASNGSAYLYSRDSGGDYLGPKGNSNVRDEYWHHIVAIRKGDQAFIYIDGIEEAKDNNTSVDDTLSNRNFVIADDDQPDRPFEGDISNVRVYNHSLTFQEIQYLYQVGSRGLYTSDKRTL